METEDRIYQSLTPEGRAAVDEFCEKVKFRFADLCRELSSEDETKWKHWVDAMLASKIKGITEITLALAAVFDIQALQDYILSKTLLIFEPATYITRLRGIVQDYIKEVADSLNGFCIDDIMEASFGELQHLLHDLQSFESNKCPVAHRGFKSHSEESEIKLHFFEYITPLKHFYYTIRVNSEVEVFVNYDTREWKRTAKYLNRLRVEILGLPALALEYPHCGN